MKLFSDLNNMHSLVCIYLFKILNFYLPFIYPFIDNACREYLFVTEFFMVRGSQAQELFNNIMGKTMSLLIVRFK